MPGWNSSAGALAAVRQRIDGAVAAAGRQERPPQLIVVTKFHPAEDVRRLAALGINGRRENRDQEAPRSPPSCAGWIFAGTSSGQLQSNKAKSVVKYAHAVHSVDRPQLASALAKAMAAEQERTGRAPLECFIQVSLDDDAGGTVAAPSRQTSRSWPSSWPGPRDYASPASWQWPPSARTRSRPSRSSRELSARLTDVHPEPPVSPRHEPGPGTGRPVRGDTPSRWLRYSRSASGVAVVQRIGR